MPDNSVPSSALTGDLHASARGAALAVTAGVMASAGVVHLRYGPEHMMEWVGFGLAFYAMGIAQIAGAAVLLAARRNRFVRSVAVWGNVAIALVWLLSRTVGLPIGPEPWHPEALGAADLLCTVAEVWVAVVVLALVPTTRTVAAPAPAATGELEPAFSA